MDTGVRKFGIAALVASGAVAADRFDVALAVFAVYTVANVVLKMFNKEAESAE